ncbi:MAG: hypothetical protein ACREPM_24265, partial [Gemmatimonadaceae bacterium]
MPGQLVIVDGGMNESYAPLDAVLARIAKRCRSAAAGTELTWENGEDMGSYASALVGGGMQLVTEEELAEAAAKELAAHPPTSLDEFPEWAQQVNLSREAVFEQWVKTFGAEKRRTDWAAFYNKLQDALGTVANAPKITGQRGLHSDVAWEKIDPKHRSTMLLVRCYWVYEQKKPVQDFFEWLDALPEFERVKMLAGSGSDAPVDKSGGLKPSDVVMFVKGVKYLDDAARPSYAVTVSRGRLERDGKPFDTGKLSTVFSGVGWGIFVQSPKTKMFYSGSHTMGLFHHSTFLAGEPVMSAGEWKVTDGRLEVMTPKSGHYQPSLGEIVAALQSLRDAGADLSGAKVLVYKDKKKTLIDVT